MPGTFSPAADFKRNHKLAIPACITARAWRTCRDASRDCLPAVAGKTFTAFPAHAHPQFYLFGKRPMFTLVCFSYCMTQDVVQKVFIKAFTEHDFYRAAPRASGYWRRGRVVGQASATTVNAITLSVYHRIVFKIGENIPLDRAHSIVEVVSHLTYA